MLWMTIFRRRYSSPAIVTKKGRLRWERHIRKTKLLWLAPAMWGEAIAYTLMVRDQANDIVLVDVNEARAKGAALDIAHGTSFYKQIWVRQGGYEECADARLIIITAGVAEKTRPDPSGPGKN